MFFLHPRGQTSPFTPVCKPFQLEAFTNTEVDIAKQKTYSSLPPKKKYYLILVTTNETVNWKKTQTQILNIQFNSSYISHLFCS